jgi:hypothetical protein
MDKPVPTYASIADEESDRAFDAVETRVTVARLSAASQTPVPTNHGTPIFGERSQREIAEVLGMSQMHVSRLRRDALGGFR